MSIPLRLRWTVMAAASCHPRTDRPLQGDAMQLHQPLAVRCQDGHGAVAMACSTCQGASNHVESASVTVPGNPYWHLAAIQMASEGRQQLGELIQAWIDAGANCPA